MASGEVTAGVRADDVVQRLRDYSAALCEELEFLRESNALLLQRKEQLLSDWLDDQRKIAMLRRQVSRFGERPAA